ncbi:DUF3072 domain-containing protein [Wenxinia marina]|uniref:DUF3072 domain-containing protein n=1 Tax=Wenxinia marina DSM 24838 TaxID=1123501 RepID=A0A0D0PAN5_9RHOB|nr:DUF3072 domain-containing protein [Wenxinia marina]KIQ68546.1 hypothetical protein Wenmar_02817 [Wenxinia marina DSM 24838]GGL66787.1 hypothetical protein GCM10011392_21600 [Wenxinia marina]
MIPPSKAVLPEPEAERSGEGAEAMTSRQEEELKALCDRTGEVFDPSLSRSQADHRIGKLREIAGDN